MIPDSSQDARSLCSLCLRVRSSFKYKVTFFSSVLYIYILYITVHSYTWVFFWLHPISLSYLIKSQPTSPLRNDSYIVNLCLFTTLFDPSVEPLLEKSVDVSENLILLELRRFFMIVFTPAFVSLRFTPPFYCYIIAFPGVSTLGHSRTSVTVPQT